MGRPTTVLIALAIWVLACFIALPQFIFFTTIVFETEGGGGDGSEEAAAVNRTVCISEWPDGPSNESYLELV